MSWVDITVIVVPLVLAGTVALLLIRTMVRSRQQSKPKASSQVSRPKRSTADQSPPVRRDPPSMHSFTPEVKASQTTDEDSVFGQAGRDRMSSPPSSAAPSSDAISSPAPSPPPSSVETFWSDFKGERSAKFISFINFKGGVGKSTCAAELSAALASQHGKRVLLIDLDPQTNATFYFMDYSQWEHWQQTAGSLRTLFDAFLAGNGEQFDISRVIKRDLMSIDGESIVPNLHLLPSHLALVLIDIQLAAKAEILHLAQEFLARFEQPDMQQEAAADAASVPAPIKLYTPAMTQDEMSPIQGGHSDAETSASETTAETITLAAKSS